LIGSYRAEDGRGEPRERVPGQREVPERDRLLQAEAPRLRDRGGQDGDEPGRDRRDQGEDPGGQQGGGAADRQAGREPGPVRRQADHVPAAGDHRGAQEGAVRREPGEPAGRACPAGEAAQGEAQEHGRRWRDSQGRRCNEPDHQGSKKALILGRRREYLTLPGLAPVERIRIFLVKSTTTITSHTSGMRGLFIRAYVPYNDT